MYLADISKHIVGGNILRVSAGRSLSLAPQGDVPQDFCVEVERGGRLDLLLLHSGCGSSQLCVSQAEDSCVNLFLLALGGGEVSQSVRVDLLGERAECGVFGFSAASLTQQHRSSVAVNHVAAGCRSEQVFRQVADGSAVVRFEGRVRVLPNAQGSDARQSCKTLLLGERSRAHVQPQLEIYADDVKCSHGATVGQLSGEALFYLRSRGVGLRQAQQLLLLGFADEVVQKIPAPALRKSIAERIARNFEF
ncbi:MAG: SufD family Fe-S cluster assembly protein [Prevotellaceae bacterium]|nr:SufD family Fe-S cluster assembly protein [Prevotellaceae bacterium]